MNKVSDQYLDMELFRQGEEAVFSSLVGQYHRPLIYFAQNIVKAMDVAEDIVSEMFISLWQNRAHFISESKIKAFLYISTKNACFNYQKSRRRKVAFEDVDQSELADDTDLTEWVVKTEMLEAVYQAILTLPEKQKSVLELTFKEELSTEEISIRLGMSPASVFANRSRALNRLRLLFEKNALLLANR